MEIIGHLLYAGHWDTVANKTDSVLASMKKIEMHVMENDLREYSILECFRKALEDIRRMSFDRSGTGHCLSERE